MYGPPPPQHVMSAHRSYLKSCFLPFPSTQSQSHLRASISLVPVHLVSIQSDAGSLIRHLPAIPQSALCAGTSYLFPCALPNL
jgi:hypothetical protein